MNNRLYNRLLDVSRALKVDAQTGEKYHVSFLIRKSRIYCIGFNNYNKSHLTHRFGHYYSNKFSVNDYRPSLHSECSVAIRAGLEDWRGLDLFNIRIDNNGRASISRPCPNCLRVVTALRPNRIFYSVSDEQFAELS